MPTLTNTLGYELTSSELDIIEKLASIGLSQKDIAEHLDLDEKTFIKILKRDREALENFSGNIQRRKEFQEFNAQSRLNRGKQVFKTMVAGGLTNHALEGNLTALMFLARSKLKWSDRGDAKEDTEEAESLSEITVNFVAPEKLPE